MVCKSTAQVEARERARDRMADKHATARDAAVTAARNAYDTAMVATHTAQAEKALAMIERGESAADVAELTGWTAKQVRAAA